MCTCIKNNNFRLIVFMNLVIIKNKFDSNNFTSNKLLNGPTDGRTKPLIELLFATKNSWFLKYRGNGVRRTIKHQGTPRFPFIHPFIHSFIHSVVHSVIHSFNHSFIHSIYAFGRIVVWLLFLQCIHLCLHFLIHKKITAKEVYCHEHQNCLFLGTDPQAELPGLGP